MIKKYLAKGALIISFFILILSCSKDDSSSAPLITANFSSDITTLFENESVNFIDNSLGNPTSWEWIFEGGTPSNSNSKNPTITYPLKGEFKVTLRVSNGANNDEVVKINYIIVENDLFMGIVGKYNLDGDGNDSSSFQNDGVIFGNVNPIQNRKGEPNSSMFFKDFEGFIEVGDPAALNLISEMSISVWVNPDGNQFSWDTIVSKWQNTGTIGGVGWGYYLGLNPDGLNLRWNVSGQIVEMNNPIPTLEWTHIVVTFDQNTINLFLNGQLENQMNTGAPLIQTSESFRIGQQSGNIIGAGGFNGAIDDIYIFDRVLNLSEINELYNE